MDRRLLDEMARVRTLQELAILDTPPEAAFDAVTELAAELFAVPIAFISLVDSDRQWFKSRLGLDITETSRDVAFGDVAIHQDQVLVVTDAKADPRFCDNPLVTGHPFMRFFACAPLRYKESLIGTLCIVDTVPRPDVSAARTHRLEQLAAVVSTLLDYRKGSGSSGLRVDRIHRALLRYEMAEQLTGVGHLYGNGAGKLLLSPGLKCLCGRPGLPDEVDVAEFVDGFAAESRTDLSSLLAGPGLLYDEIEFTARLAPHLGGSRRIAWTFMPDHSSDRASDRAELGVFGVARSVADPVSQRLAG